MNNHSLSWDSAPSVAAHPAARAWISDLAVRVRPATVLGYAHDLDDFLEACAGLTSAAIIEADSALLDTYTLALSSRPPRPGRHQHASTSRRRSGPCLAPATIARRLAAIRTWYSWLLLMQLRHAPSNPVRAPSRAQRALRSAVSIPSDQDFRRIISYVLSDTLSPRDSALLLTLYSGALRVSEPTHLDLDHLNASTHEILIPHWLTKSPTMPGSIVLSNQVWSRICRYVQGDRARVARLVGLPQGTGPLFLSEANRTTGQRLGPHSVWDLVVRLRRALDLPDLTPHSFRHLCLTHLLLGGLSVYDVSAYARHARIQTTSTYLHPSGPRLARLVSAAHRKHWEQVGLPMEDGDA